MAVIRSVNKKDIRWIIRFSKSGRTVEVPFSDRIDWALVGSGCDFDGDGRDDLAGFDSSRRQLHYLSSSKDSGKTTLSPSLPKHGHVVDVSCASINANKRSDMIVLESVPPHGKIPSYSLLSAFDILTGKVMLQRKIKGRVDKIAPIQMVPGDGPGIAYYAFQENGTISYVTILVPNAHDYTAARVKLNPPLTAFSEAVFSQRLDAQLGSQGALTGFVGMTNKGPYVFDFATLSMGGVPVIQNAQVVRDLNPVLSRSRMLTSVSAIKLTN